MRVYRTTWAKRNGEKEIKVFLDRGLRERMGTSANGDGE